MLRDLLPGQVFGFRQGPYLVLGFTAELCPRMGGGPRYATHEGPSIRPSVRFRAWGWLNVRT
jgi:hypothetical protein